MADQDPFELFHPRFLFQTPSEADKEVIESAKKAITAAKAEALTPETRAKYQDQLKKIIDESPNKAATASYLLEHIREKGLIVVYLTFRNGCDVVKTGGRGRYKRSRDEMKDGTKAKTATRSSRFTSLVKSGGICQITGGPSDQLVSSHILPFSASNNNPKMMEYLELVKALFGPDALQRLLENVLNGDKDNTRNINRLDNGIAMEPNAHGRWDAMGFRLEVLWDTYDPSTKQFSAKFHWISTPGTNMNNYWKDPLMHGGLAIPFPIIDGDIIPFRRRNPPFGSSATAPSRISTLSTPSTPSLTRSTETPLPSAHLLYVREILTRVAHAIGTAGYPEYDYYDDDDDVSVSASDPGEEEINKLSDPESAEEKVPQDEMPRDKMPQEKIP